MSIIGSNVIAGASGQAGYNLTNSLRFRNSATPYLNRTPASTGNRQIMTFSFWMKRGLLTYATNYLNIFTAYPGASNIDLIAFSPGSDSLLVWFNGQSSANLITTQVFRDPSAWYHIVVAIDTTQATAANRIKMYVNGTQITSFSTATYPSQNYNTYWNSSSYAAAIGTNLNGPQGSFDGYLTEINFIDGQALTPSSFGSTNSTTGVWQPAKYTGTYGTNGYYLNFNSIALTSGSNTGLGKDSSGNGNYWNTNNISVTAGTTYDAMLDVPTNTSATVANYCMLNPLEANPAVTVAQGNLSYTSSNDRIIKATMSVTSGKWYWEFTAGNGGNPSGCGAINPSVNIYAVVNLNTATAGVSYLGNGNKSVNGTATAYGSTFTTSDIIGVALDLTSATNTITFYKNNTSQGAITLTSSLEWCPAFDQNAGTNYVNFGQRPFTYTPPSGYVALNTYNLPTPTILQGNLYMDATLWTGAGASTMTITNTAGFKPDMVWAKSRSNAYSNLVWNSIVGVGNTTMLITNTTDAEGAYYGNANLTSFNSNGFSTGATSGTNVLNANGVTNVAWQWQAGQGSSSSNTSGSITSTVSVNTTAGFSIVTYTGNATNPSTVGHGLGVAPKMIITKQRNAGTYAWNSYHASLGNTQYVALSTIDAASSAVSLWNNTSPTSTVFTINHAAVNSATTYVAYCWAEIAGFSKFGSYTGNGSADGTFVFTNLLPKFIMIKRTDTTGNWIIWDTARNTYNVLGEELYPNLSNAAASSTDLDVLSNGFKLRSTNVAFNASGGTYVYACFASNPFKNSNGY